MDFSFLSYALLLEIILLLVGWIIFIHWRLSKHKKTITEISEQEPPNPFEVYMQFLNRELSETKSHLDKLKEESADDIETINMYQYRLKHLESEQEAMEASKGDVIKFWEIYRSKIEFVYHEEVEEEIANEEAEESVETPEPVVQTEQPETMQNALDGYKNNSQALVNQSEEVIELVQKLASQSDSEELKHMLSLLTSEKESLLSQLNVMEQEYNRLMNNAAISMQSSNANLPSQADREQDEMKMSKMLNKQNSRISELSNLIGDLSLELEDKKRLIEETEWVTRQLKETEQVVVILEDENSFLRAQIKQLLDTSEE